MGRCAGQLGRWYRVHGDLNDGLFSGETVVNVTDNSLGVNVGGGQLLQEGLGAAPRLRVSQG